MRGYGDNSARAPAIRVQVRLFNSLSGFGIGQPDALDMPAGATVADIVRRFRLPAESIFLVLVNGCDATRAMGRINLERELEDGDVVALSGPVPYSWGYGAPVV